MRRAAPAGAAFWHDFSQRLQPRSVGLVRANCGVSRRSGTSGYAPAGVICEIIIEHVDAVATVSDLIEFCDIHEFEMLAVAERVLHVLRKVPSRPGSIIFI